jgi:hypothetical protein
MLLHFFDGFRAGPSLGGPAMQDGAMITTKRTKRTKRKLDRLARAKRCFFVVKFA